MRTKTFINGVQYDPRDAELKAKSKSVLKSLRRNELIDNPVPYLSGSTLLGTISEQVTVDGIEFTIVTYKVTPMDMNFNLGSPIVKYRTYYQPTKN
jgi:hypothetical protein